MDVVDFSSKISVNITQNLSRQSVYSKRRKYLVLILSRDIIIAVVVFGVLIV